MANATQLPLYASNKFFFWNAKLTDSLNDSTTDQSVYWDTVPIDENGATVTGAYLMAVRNTRRNPNHIELMRVPASGVAADGLSATGVVRGLKPSGIDYTTGDSDFVYEFDSGDEVFCAILPQDGELLRAAIQGLIATGNTNLILGNDAAADVTIKASSGTGTSRDFLKQTSAGVAQYWNGAAFVSFNDSIASSLLKVSATDTTPDYLQGKVTSSDSSIVFAVTGGGGDETLNITTALPARISSHAIYTPAYMTGGSSAESNYLLWLGTSNGSVRFTVDGTIRDVTGIDFTTGVTSMANVATKIQTALRALTGSTETVVWSTDHFVVTSVNTTSSSQVSVASATGGGTDISGAGAFVGMDSETGRGTATAAVLDPAQDSGKIGLLNARGSFPSDLARDFVDPLGYQAKGGIMVATAANTVDEFTVGANDFGIRADSVQSTGVKWVPVSRILAKLSSAVTVANTTTETNLFSVSVPANVLSTTNVIKGEILISTIASAAGASNDIAFKFKYGGTTIGTLNIINGTIPAATQGKLTFSLIAGATASAQVGWFDAVFQTVGGQEVPDGASFEPTGQSAGSDLSNVFLQSNGTSAIDSTSAQTLVVTAQWAALSASNTVTALYGYTELIA